MQKKLLKNYQPIVFFGAMGILFLIMLALTTFTPLMLDDYLYAFIYGTSERVDSFGDIIASMTLHYNTWGGRVTVHSLVQLFLWMPKVVFNICNALIYVLLSYLVYRFANTKKYDIKFYFAVIIAMWFAIPIFGETVLWLSGSFNYLWNVTFNLLWLLQFKKQLEQPTAKALPFQILFCIASFLVGSISENVSFACLLAAVLILVQMKTLKLTVARWMWISTACALLGWLFLMVAPGNYARADSISTEAVTLWTIYDRIVSVTAGLNGYCMVPLALFVLLFVLAIRQKVAAGTLFTSLIFMLSAMASQYAMIASNTFSTRTMMGTQFFIFIACATLYPTIELDLFELLSTVIIYVALLYTAFSMFLCADELMRKYFESERRDAYVVEQRDSGEMDVTVDVIYCDSIRSVFGVTIGDLEDYPDYWVNKYYALYYGVDSVTALK